MRIRRRNLNALAAALVMLAPSQVSAAPTLIYAEIVLNGLRAGIFMLVRRDDGFFIRPDALRDLAIPVHSGITVRIDAEDFVPLTALSGAVVRFDEARQELRLDVGAEHFALTRLSPVVRKVRASKSARAVFINYDINVEADRQLAAGGLIETGVSGDWGLAINTVTVGRAAAAGSGATRLDTYLVRDNPETLTRLVVGDALTAPIDGLPVVRFGGIRFGTAFELQPDFITFPTPTFTGQTANPSQVELLVNNALAYRSDVARGPFAIQQVPLVTGAGQATVVVRDALGIERSVTSSYYTSPDLLRPGLSEWSVEGGAIRRDYGIDSFSYGAPFVAGSYRTGLTDTLTVDGRVELSTGVRMASGGMSVVWPVLGELGISGGVSDSDVGRGSFYALSFRRVSRSWSLAASRRRATKAFVSVGDLVNGPAADRLNDQLQVSASAFVGRVGSVGLSYSALTYTGDRRARLATASYGVNVGSRGYFSAFALGTASSDRPDETTLGVSFSLSLGNRTNLFAQADGRSVRADVQLTPVYGGGVGYRLGVTRGDSEREQAEVSWRGQAVQARVEAARVDGRTAGRLQIGGGLLLAGESLVATRRIEDGLAVVDVGGAAGVRIYQDNRLVARTDAKGRAVVPNLRAYQENRISLDPTDLPLGTTMPHTMLTIVPRFRGAARAAFQTATAMPVTVIVEQPDGALLEAGTAVEVGDTGSTFVGFGGEIFLSNATPGLTLRADTAAGPCTVTLDRDLDFAALAKIGPLRCHHDGQLS